MAEVEKAELEGLRAQLEALKVLTEHFLHGFFLFFSPV
jgi:hypothetical protein